MSVTAFAQALPPDPAAWRALVRTAVPVVLGFLAVYLLLPRPAVLPRGPGRLAGAVALILGGWLLVWWRVWDVERLLFYAFSALALFGGGMLLTQANPVHAALAFALVILSSCGLFLLQAAPFLMAATLIVYAGAILVTFLFVIMLAQQAGQSDADRRSREPHLSVLAGAALLFLLLVVIGQTYDARPLDALVRRAEAARAQPTPGAMLDALGDDRAFFAHLEREADRSGSPEADTLAADVADVRGSWGVWKGAGDADAMRAALTRLAAEGRAVADTWARPGRPGPTPALPAENVASLGGNLFTEYLVAVELAGALLLVATVGAIAIAGRRREGVR